MPDAIEPDTIGILYQLGIQIKYAVIISAPLFVIVILLNKKSFWTPQMLLAILG